MKERRKDFAELGEQTKAVHAGEFPDPLSGASSPNLVMSTTFVVDADTGKNDKPGLLYNCRFFRFPLFPSLPYRFQYFIHCNIGFYPFNIF